MQRKCFQMGFQQKLRNSRKLFVPLKLTMWQGKDIERAPQSTTNPLFDRGYSLGQGWRQEGTMSFQSSTQEPHLLCNSIWRLCIVKLNTDMKNCIKDKYTDKWIIVKQNPIPPACNQEEKHCQHPKDAPHDSSHTTWLLRPFLPCFPLYASPMDAFLNAKA